MSTLTLNIIALQLLWAASASVYLSSNTQCLLSTGLPKSKGWCLFFGFATAGIIFLDQNLDLLSALFFALVIIMTSWITLALSAPYWKNLKGVMGSGSAIMLITALLGGGHVA